MAKRVLIVDDEEHILAVVRFRLTAEGYEVLTATDGAAALETIRREAPDLVLLDMRLPTMDGCELCRRVKADEALGRTPVILFSASDTQTMTAKVAESGADGYIIKPFGREELLGMVREHLRERTTP